MLFTGAIAFGSYMLGVGLFFSDVAAFKFLMLQYVNQTS